MLVSITPGPYPLTTNKQGINFTMISTNPVSLTYTYNPASRLLSAVAPFNRAIRPLC